MNAPTVGEQFTAGVRAQWISGDRWWRQERLRSDFEDEIIEKLGGPAAIAPQTPPDEERFYRGGANARRDYLLERIAEARARDPVKVGVVPINADEWEADIRHRDEQDEAENAAVLNRGANSWVQMAGGLVGGFVDETTLPLMFVGGSPFKLAKFVASEAALGVAGEIPDIVRRDARNRRLGREPVSPGDAATQMIVGGLTAGALAGVVGGAARMLGYAQARREGEAALRGERPGAKLEDDVGAAERALRLGREPPPPALYRPDPSIAPEDDPAVDNVLRLIGKLEAPKGFDQVSSYAVVAPPQPLTRMSINQVMDWQAANTAAGGRSHAAGRFQFMRSTLGEMRDRLGLSGNELFDEAMQKRLAIELMRVEGLDDWRAGRITDEEFGNRLANRWAALPKITGPKAGRSAYDGDGLNGAGTDVDAVLAVLRGEEVPDVIPPGGSGFVGRAGRRGGARDDFLPASHVAGDDLPEFPLPDARTATAINLGGTAEVPRIDGAALVETAARREAARAADPEAFRLLDEIKAQREAIDSRLAAASSDWPGRAAPRGVGADQAAVAASQDAGIERALAEIDAREAGLQQQMRDIRTAGKRVIRDQLKRIPHERAMVMQEAGRVETPEVFRLNRQLAGIEMAVQNLAPRIAKAFAAADARPKPVLPMPQALRRPPQVHEAARGLDVAAYGEGTASQTVQAADEAVEAALATGPFGPVLERFRGDWRGAVDELMRLQKGEAPAVLSHPEAPEIDLVWGERGTGPGNGYGLAKIAARHPEVLDDLQGRLSAATTILSRSENRIRLASEQDIFVISRDWKGESKTWLLTAYEKQRGDGRSMGRSDGSPEGSSPSAPLQRENNAAALADQEAEAAERAIAEARAAMPPEMEITLDLAGTKVTRRAGEILADIDAERNLEQVLEACQIGRARQ